MPDTGINPSNTIGDLLNTVIPAGMTLAQYLNSRNTLNNATGTINTGVTNATQGLNNALTTQQGIAGQQQTNTNNAANAATLAQLQALAQQANLYNTTISANQPYQQTGLTGNQQLQGLIENPNSLSTTPGYQFELGQGLQAQQRQEAAQGTLQNGGTIKAATRYALDYANTKYNDAVQRLLAVTNVGQTANAANQRAGEVYGGQVGTGETNIGNIATGAAAENNRSLGTLATETGQNAENLANLTLGGAQLNATNQGLQGQATNNLLQGLSPTLLKLAQKIPGWFGTNPDTVMPSVGAPQGPGLPGNPGGTWNPDNTDQVSNLPGSIGTVAGLGTAGMSGLGATAAGATPAVSVVIPGVTDVAAAAAGAEGAAGAAGATGAAAGAVGSGTASGGALASISSLLTN